MILVTGANGFLGQYICEKLLAQGKQVRALVRDEKKLDAFAQKSALDIREADLLDPVLLSETLSGVSTVIHCAALVSFNPADCREMMETNITGTRNLVNACMQHGTDFFIHISSVAAIGRHSDNGAIDENTKWQESKYNTCYGKSKHESELEVWRGISEGLPGVILNPSVIIGRPIAGGMSNQLLKFVRSEPSYYPTGDLNYVDVRDVCEAICRLLEERITGERFILNAESIPYRDFLTRAAEKIGVKPPTRPAGNFILRLALYGDILRHMITGKPRTITRTTIRVSKTKIYFSNEKVRRELNSTFAPLSDSLDWIFSGE